MMIKVKAQNVMLGYSYLKIMKRSTVNIFLMLLKLLLMKISEWLKFIKLKIIKGMLSGPVIIKNMYSSKIQKCSGGFCLIT